MCSRRSGLHREIPGAGQVFFALGTQPNGIATNPENIQILVTTVWEDSYNNSVTGGDSSHAHDHARKTDGAPRRLG